MAIVDKKCVIPEKLISGCSAYDENGKCATCYIDYDLIEEIVFLKDVKIMNKWNMFALSVKKAII